MKKSNIIVFDVDNTLVKGNLTVFFIKSLIKGRLRLLRKFLSIALRGAFLVLWQLPSTAKHAMKTGNFNRLDKLLITEIKKIYVSIFRTFKELNLLEKKLQKKADVIFSESFFKKHVYKKGVEKIKHHLKNKNNIVILLSGSFQEPVNAFYNVLCEQFDKENIDYQSRFFARGTDLSKAGTLSIHPVGGIQPCIGSEKNRILKKLLSSNNIHNYEITFIYSDNMYMTDLPLLIESKKGGAIICEKSNLYSFLPKKLLQMLVFLPSWEKDSI